MSANDVLLKVYSWSTKLTQESKGHPIRGDFSWYYWPGPVKRLLFNLEHNKRAFIALVGLQGTGKTTAVYVLADYLRKEGKDSWWIKWTQDWTKRILAAGSVNQEIQSYKEAELTDLLEGYGRAGRKFKGKYPTLDLIEQAKQNPVFMDKLLGKAKAKEIEREAIYNRLGKLDNLFIDLPDYSKVDRRLMTRDLDQIQQLWEQLQDPTYGDVNIVITLQKELFKGHFLFGKMQIYDLELLKPGELIESYKQIWNTVEPFTEQALYLLAQLSRGVYRRFMKYINMTIERFSIEKGELPINEKYVQEAITLDQLAKDMELELADIFRPMEQRKAVEILNFLRQSGEVNQSAIAESLDIHPGVLSKMLAKLETYRYVQRRRHEKEVLVKLA